MSDEPVLTDDELVKLELGLMRDEIDYALVLKLITALLEQRRVLRELFSLFRDIDEYALRQSTDSVRKHNLDTLKKRVGMADKK